MGTFITTVVAGVIVALVSAFAIYYFGVRQERQKQAYEMQREERNRRDERQAELNEQRVKILDMLRNHIRSAIHDCITVSVEVGPTGVLGDIGVGIDSEEFNLKELEEFSEELSELSDERLRGLMAQEDWLRHLEKAQESLTKKEDQTRTSLLDFYRQQKPHLEPRTQKIFDAFYNEFDKCFLLLMGPLLELQMQTLLATDEEDDPELVRDRLRSIAKMEKEYEEWDAQRHLDALDAEVVRITSAD